MRRIFWGFWRNWFLTDPLHYFSSRFDFGFEFAKIFVIEKRLPNSPSRGVADSPNRRVGESTTPRLTESESRLLNVQMKIRRDGDSARPDSASREVSNSPTRRVGELSTPRLAESGSRYGESGNHYSNFLKFHHFKQLNQPFKGPF